MAQAEPVRMLNFGPYRLAVHEGNPGWLAAVHGPGTRGFSRDIGPYHTADDAELGRLLQHAKFELAGRVMAPVLPSDPRPS